MGRPSYTNEPPVVQLDLGPITLLNRDIHGRRYQLILYPHPAAWARRRNYWPHPQKQKIFYYWHAGPIQLRRFT